MEYTLKTLRKDWAKPTFRSSQFLLRTQHAFVCEQSEWGALPAHWKSKRPTTHLHQSTPLPAQAAMLDDWLFTPTSFTRTWVWSILILVSYLGFLDHSPMHRTEKGIACEENEGRNECMGGWRCLFVDTCGVSASPLLQGMLIFFPHWSLMCYVYAWLHMCMYMYVQVCICMYA